MLELDDGIGAMSGSFDSRAAKIRCFSDGFAVLTR